MVPFRVMKLLSREVYFAFTRSQSYKLIEYGELAAPGSATEQRLAWRVIALCEETDDK